MPLVGTRPASNNPRARYGWPGKKYWPIAKHKNGTKAKLINWVKAWALESPPSKTLRTFRVTIIGYTIKKVKGTIRLRSQPASLDTPKTKPRSMVTGIAVIRFFEIFCNMFHIVISLSSRAGAAIAWQAGHGRPADLRSFAKTSKSSYLVKPRFCQVTVEKVQDGLFQHLART